jgi:hypothetical protein
MFPASFRCLRACIHGYADISLRECRRVVGAVAGHSNQLAFGLLALDQRHFVFRLGFGEEIIDARLGFLIIVRGCNFANEFTAARETIFLSASGLVWLALRGP